ncbi:MAG: 5'-nucleotidase C-terminal domain-containing protein [Candidatus Tectomicrobia bacterium]|nr:5'-nucleotidase C-terminal domain-containing protein [Candidatus Tectomicrobia bacterium]
MRTLSRRTFIALLCGSLIVLSLTPSAPAGTPAERSARLTILQINDVYEITSVEKGKKGGLARVATLRDRIARESPNLVFVLPGDFLSPSTMSSLFQGSQMVATLNAAGLDLATFGNHEFDFGLEVTRERMRESRFTWVSSNVLDPVTGLPFGGAAPFVLREYGGIRVAFIGLVTPETYTLSKGAAGLKFLDPIQAAKEVVARARRARADLIVALTHQDMADDQQLAAAVPEIDVIAGGHEHVPLDARVGRTLILKTGSDAVSLGRIDLTVTVGKGGRRVESKWELIPVTDQIPEKPEVAGLVKQYESLMAAQLDVVVGATSVPLDARNELVRTQESAVGNLITDLMRAALQADVALINGGGIRGNTVLAAGQLRRRDVLTILPFANKVVKLDVTGETLRAALENGLSQVERTAGRFPQVSGLRFTFDPKRPAGSRLVSVTAGGRPLEPQARYTLATFDFILGGGDGYTMLKEGKVLVKAENGPMDSDVFIDRLKAGPIAPVLDGRIQRVP